jgi:hypothetical protein
LHAPQDRVVPCLINGRYLEHLTLAQGAPYLFSLKYTPLDLLLGAATWVLKGVREGRYAEGLGGSLSSFLNCAMESHAPAPPIPVTWSDREWALLEPLLPAAKPGERPRSVNLRLILNGIFSLLRSGCAWRYVPRDYGPWSTVLHYFRRWRRSRLWTRIHAILRERVSA